MSNYVSLYIVNIVNCSKITEEFTEVIFMLKIALCDDNSKFLDHMNELVANEFELQAKDDFIINNYTSSKLLFIHHSSEPYDVIFLDIDMPDLTGFELANKLQETNKKSCVIFVSNHSELVFDSFYFHPLNFIVKDTPEAMKESLHNVVIQLFGKIKQDKKLILESVESGRISVYLSDILYIESSKHYIIYHLTNSRTVMIRENISEAENKYAEFDFIRIHKKYIVNLKHIFNIDKNNCLIIFKQGLDLPISRNYKSMVDEKLTEYLRNN